MGLETAGLVTISILALDIWAAISVMGSRCSRSVKLAWILAIAFLPIIGWLGWLAAGPRPHWRDFY